MAPAERAAAYIWSTSSLVTLELKLRLACQASCISSPNPDRPVLLLIRERLSSTRSFMMRSWRLFDSMSWT